MELKVDTYKASEKGALARLLEAEKKNQETVTGGLLLRSSGSTAEEGSSRGSSRKPSNEELEKLLW